MCNKINCIFQKSNGNDGYGKVYVPLEFWFCRNIGLALPLIALQYHEVKINLTLNSDSNNNISVSNVALWADYIFLDTDERRRFAQVSHEYLIEQVQHQNFSDGKNCDLTFNHPVKELVWTGGMTNGVIADVAAQNKLKYCE